MFVFSNQSKKKCLLNATFVMVDFLYIIWKPQSGNNSSDIIEMMTMVVFQCDSKYSWTQIKKGSEILKAKLRQMKWCNKFSDKKLIGPIDQPLSCILKDKCHLFADIFHKSIKKLGCKSTFRNITLSTCKSVLYFLFYCPPTKLQEGNIFSHVCLSVCLKGGPVWPLTIMHWTSP